MHIVNNTGADIRLAGLTLTSADAIDLPFDHYMADEDRRAKMNALAADGDITVTMTDDDGDNSFPALTAGELEDEAVSVRLGARYFGKVSIPGVLTVADSADSFVVPVNSKLIGVLSNLGTYVAGAALVHGVKKNGVDVFAGHVADRVTVIDGGTQAVAGPGGGGSAFNAANLAAMNCEAGDVLTINVTAIGTTSGHHGSDLSTTFVLETAAASAAEDD